MMILGVPIRRSPINVVSGNDAEKSENYIGALDWFHEAALPGENILEHAEEDIVNHFSSISLPDEDFTKVEATET